MGIKFYKPKFKKKVGGNGPFSGQAPYGIPTPPITEDDVPKFDLTAGYSVGAGYANPSQTGLVINPFIQLINDVLPENLISAIKVYIDDIFVGTADRIPEGYDPPYKYQQGYDSDLAGEFHNIKLIMENIYGVFPQELVNGPLYFPATDDVYPTVHWISPLNTSSPNTANNRAEANGEPFLLEFSATQTHNSKGTNNLRQVFLYQSEPSYTLLHTWNTEDIPNDGNFSYSWSASPGNYRLQIAASNDAYMGSSLDIFVVKT